MKHVEIKVSAVRDLRTGKSVYSIAVIGTGNYTGLSHAECFTARGDLIDHYTNDLFIDSVHAEAIPENK